MPGNLFGNDIFGDPVTPPSRGKVSDTFIMPPFTVLDARQGWWQDRKRAWLSLGIKSEVGRGDGGRCMPPGGMSLSDTYKAKDAAKGAQGGLLYPPGASFDFYREKTKKEAELAAAAGAKEGLIFSASASVDFYEQKRAKEAELGKKLTAAEFTPLYEPTCAADIGTSIFDPVLCEVAYRWFAPPGGQIIDPFAGGSVRGVVAASLGFDYYGGELRAEQVAANRAQAEEIVPMNQPTWVCGDSAVTGRGAPEADLVFSCHPEGTAVLTRRLGWIDIASVLEEDEVLSHNGEWRSVSQTLSRNYSGKVYEFSRFYRANNLNTTAEHPLLTRRPKLRPKNQQCKCGCGKIARNGVFCRGHRIKGRKQGNTKYDQPELADFTEAWLRADEVAVGDYLLEPIPKPTATPLDGSVIWEYRPTFKLKRGRDPRGNAVVKATKHLGALLGYYLAEGWPSKGGVTFAFHSKEKPYHREVRRCWRAVFGRANKVTFRGGDNINTTSVICMGRIAAKFFLEKGGGKGASVKRVPGWVFGCSDEIIKELIRCIWAGDGWACSSDGDLGYATVSRNLAEDLRRLLLKLGVVAAIRRRKPRATTYCANPKATWSLAARGEYAAILARIVGVKIKTPPTRRGGRQPFINDGFAHYRVRDIKTHQATDLRVFNIEVRVDHSYLAEGVVSHNCPPYYDLEVYSDDEADLSNMTYPQFLEAYRAIIKLWCGKLKNNRFACWVIGDIRDPATGLYRNFVGDTVAAFKDAGLGFYNEAILVTSVGSASLRVTRQFNAGRKFAKCHQQFLTFVKGDWKAAAQATQPRP